MSDPQLTVEKALRSTSADRVYEALQNAIVHGELAAGARIGEAELAERFGTSRGPLREALRGSSRSGSWSAPRTSAYASLRWTTPRCSRSTTSAKRSKAWPHGSRPST